MEKKFEICVVLFCIFITGVGCGYTWRMIHEIQEPIKYEYPTMSEKEKAEFCKVLKKHGLLEASVIYEDVLGWYFIRDGKRCPFKG
jgi:hypothetical protein